MEKLSKAFHTSTATVPAVCRELCFRKAKNLNHNHNNIMNVNKPGSDGQPRSRLTSRISLWCATLVWSTHGLVSAFFHVGRQFGTSRPNTLACGLRKRPWSFLMGVTIVTPNKCQMSINWPITTEACFKQADMQTLILFFRLGVEHSVAMYSVRLWWWGVLLNSLL